MACKPEPGYRQSWWQSGGSHSRSEKWSHRSPELSRHRHCQCCSRVRSKVSTDIKITCFLVRSFLIVKQVLHSSMTSLQLSLEDLVYWKGLIDPCNIKYPIWSKTTAIYTSRFDEITLNGFYIAFYAGKISIWRVPTMLKGFNNAFHQESCV